MIQNVITPSNLGDEFDIGTIEANKIHIDQNGLISTDANNGIVLGTDNKLWNSNEVILNAGPLSGVVPNGTKWGVDTTNQVLYYSNGGVWQSVSVGQSGSALDISSGFFSETNSGNNVEHNWTGSQVYNRANITINGANLVINDPGVYLVIADAVSNANNDSYNGFYLRRFNAAGTLVQTWVSGQNGQVGVGGNRIRGGSISCVENCNAGDYYTLLLNSRDNTSFIDRASFYIERKS